MTQPDDRRNPAQNPSEESSVAHSRSKRSLYGGPARIIVESGRRALILIACSALSGEAALAGVPASHKLPLRAIENGHDVQPRADRLQALGYSDLTTQQAEEVDRLFRQIMRNSNRANQTPS
jgi:hypothetical protein